MSGWTTHSRSFALWVAAALTALSGLLAPSPAWATRIMAEAMTLGFQVKNSDVIVRGTCEDARTTWANNNIVTTYKVRVKKYLKAPGKMDLKANPVVTVAQLGGRLEGPLPLEQNYPNRAVLYAGEEVVLFLQAPTNVPRAMRARYDEYVRTGVMKRSPLMENYRFTTLDISKFNVVVDPNTRQELVTRVNFDRFGLLGSPELVKRYIDAYQAGQTTVAMQPGAAMPVQLGRPVILAPAPASTVSTEELNRQILNYTSTWENFQLQVERLRNATATPTLSEASQDPNVSE